MWKDYSKSYIKNNRASGISVMVAAFISALLLSLLCSLFYNFWKYDVERIQFEEGGWQGRITGELDAADLTRIQNYANVKNVVINEELSKEQNVVADICFDDLWTILTDMPRIAELVGLGPEAVTYHHSLLSMYLVRDPADPAPRLVFPFFLAVTAMACFSLIMIIHNSFAVSMNARIHQFGILSSIGATPGQIRICLLQEAAALCAVPVAVGNLLGIVISMGVMEGTNRIAADVPGRFDAVFGYHPMILVFSLLITSFTVWISAWLPAGKMSRLTPLCAVKNTGEFPASRNKKQVSRIFHRFRNQDRSGMSRVPGVSDVSSVSSVSGMSGVLGVSGISRILGMEGELAKNAIKAQKKNLRTATLSLTISFLAFSLMQCFFTLTGISQEMTYFARYQDSWDIMVTVKDTGIDTFTETDALQELSGVQSGIVYQKAAAKRMITEEEFSESLRAMGGLKNASEAYVSAYEGGWLVNAPIFILDDASFLAYCTQIGATPRLNGAVILNRIPDISDPDFRNRNSLPYLNENRDATVLRQSGHEEITTEIPVISYTKEPPVLREEYGTVDSYELVHFLPVSLWTKIKGQIGNTGKDTYIRVLAKERSGRTGLKELEDDVTQLISPNYTIESENRIEDKIANDNIIDGMMLLLGGFCVLLATIGIANVFSNTLGFVHQRKREFARYLSIGLTPEGIQKMFCAEALILAGRPVLITLPFTVIATGFMIKASSLDPMVFIKKAPVLPILAFILAVFGFVALAYYLGGRKVLRSSLADALRDDTLM